MLEERSRRQHERKRALEEKRLRIQQELDQEHEEWLRKKQKFEVRQRQLQLLALLSAESPVSLDDLLKQIDNLNLLRLRGIDF